MSVGKEIAQRDFSAKTIRALRKLGVELIGVQLLPVDGSYMNPDRGYVVNDNGTCRVLRFLDVRALVEQKA